MNHIIYCKCIVIDAIHEVIFIFHFDVIYIGILYSK